MWEGGSGGQIGVFWLWGLWKGRFCEVLVVASLVAPSDCHKGCPQATMGTGAGGGEHAEVGHMVTLEMS